MDDYKLPLEVPCVFYDDEFLSPTEADEYYQDLLVNTAWEKTAKINRWVALMYDGENEDYNYQYRDAPTSSSGQNNKQQQECRPFTETILAIKTKAEKWYNEKKKKANSDEKDVCFNVCLLNFYEDGNQRIGWHCDREEIGRSTPIASVSLGATRDFMIRAKQQGLEKYTVSLTAGSLIVMENACQVNYLHSIPKQANVTAGRINLTFRCKTDSEHTTAGEEEHERRDKWLERITDIAATSATTTIDEGSRNLLEVQQDGYVFGDLTNNISSDVLVAQQNCIVYTVKTNIGAEAYTAAEITEALDEHDDFDRNIWSVVPRPWDAAGYVALCRHRKNSNDAASDVVVLEEDDNTTTILSILLELRSAHHVMMHHDTFNLTQVVGDRDTVDADVAKISGEQLYQFYKQRLIEGTADIRTLSNKHQASAIVGFRVTCDRVGGPHGFRAPQVEYEIGGAMSEFYENKNCKPKMEDFDVNVRVDVIGNVVMVGTQMNVQDLSRRHFTRFRNNVTIKCNLAYIMLRCANVRPGCVVVDPFCGGGTILLEVLEMTKKQVKCVGMDVSRRSAQGARENAAAENCGPDVCEIHCIDARALRKHVEDESVDAIVTNLPWGVMTGTKNVSDLQTLYEIFLRTAWYALKDNGRIVMLVLRGLQLTRIIRKLSGRYRLLRCNVVRTTNNLPCIVVIEKIATDSLNDSIKGQLAYMSQFVQVSREMYHAIHMEDIVAGSDLPNSSKRDCDREMP